MKEPTSIKKTVIRDNGNRDHRENASAIKIGLKAFVVSALIILLLMIFSGVLTMFLPSGQYDRIVQGGRTLVVDGSYQGVPKPDYPFWRWLTAPIEILFVSGNLTLITIILFIFCVGGSIAILERAGVMEELIRLLVSRFSKRKYRLIALVILFFMAISSFIGVYEGMVPMIIFIVPLAITLGWDSLTGLGMSLLPLAFGFASAVTNPFTIAVAQKIADLPLFSGAWFRLIFFATVYGIVTAFVIRHAKKVERDPRRSPTYVLDEEIRQRFSKTAGPSALGEPSPLGEMPAQGKTVALGSGVEGTQQKGRALVWFALCVAVAMVVVFATARSPVLSDLAFPIMGILFLIGGIGGGILARLGGKKTIQSFLTGSANLLPGIVLILMAYSVKHIIVTGKIMDTILFMTAQAIRQAPPMAGAFLMYAATLGMNFFIGSASAKAFLMMPLLSPLADLVGITRQTAVLAFDFGDGFSNMIFPTNALLLIALSFTVVSYPKWMAFTWKLQLVILALTSAFLALAVAIHFGPF